MRITQGVQWGACSTLMLSSISYYGMRDFATELLRALKYVGSRQHVDDNRALLTAYKNNTIPNYFVIPQNYLGPDYIADQYAWLICSTNEDNFHQRDWFRELGFLETPESYNSKNDTSVILFFISPMDCIKNLEKYLGETDKEQK